MGNLAKYLHVRLSHPERPGWSQCQTRVPSSGQDGPRPPSHLSSNHHPCRRPCLGQKGSPQMRLAGALGGPMLVGGASAGWLARTLVGWPLAMMLVLDWMAMYRRYVGTWYLKHQSINAGWDRLGPIVFKHRPVSVRSIYVLPLSGSRICSLCANVIFAVRCQKSEHGWFGVVQPVVSLLRARRRRVCVCGCRRRGAVRQRF